MVVEGISRRCLNQDLGGFKGFRGEYFAKGHKILFKSRKGLLCH
jgi:hypothetical protein